MSLQKEKVQEITKKFGSSEQDSGRTSVQIALLTERLNQLNPHFAQNPKDHHSRLGLMRMVGQRKRLLRYLQRKDKNAYTSLIGDLGLRK